MDLEFFHGSDIVESYKNYQVHTSMCHRALEDSVHINDIVISPISEILIGHLYVSYMAHIRGLILDYVPDI